MYSTYINRFVDSGFVLKIFPEYNGNVIYLEIIPTSNNLFFIGEINFSDKMWDTHTKKYLHKDVGHEHIIKLVFFFLYGKGFEIGSDDSTYCLFSMV